ncbi:hypothetical protein [Mariniflexile sp. HMF6888]|uniref:hypothetical protein n=1 Tax=Mariniflexile sp. HMF6888 TaxID=3373086 RepID=UPI00378E3D2F
MNLIIIPFHDWRKSHKEGFRTRDVHFINALSENDSVKKILVINRPTTKVELLYKKNNEPLPGKLIFANQKFSLTEIKEKLYVTDYLSNDVLGQLARKHLWFIEKYNDKEYVDFIYTCQKLLKFDDPNLIVQNIFSYKLGITLNAKVKVFDAWDNFLKFPAYKRIKKDLKLGYSILSDKIPNWVTNSQENIEFYKKKFNPVHITLIKNGVKSNFMSGDKVVPEDIKDLKRPIIGFGGKISYLLDYELINFITKDNSNYSFVFVGQILDKNVYKKIEKRTNVFFLGDKKYSEYSNYVKNFDICIVPYNINEGQHGGDSMKAYEYLLTGKKVIGTKGNGLQDLKEYIYLPNTKEEFSLDLKDLTNKKSQINIEDYSWESKGKSLLKILKK